MDIEKLNERLCSICGNENEREWIGNIPREELNSLFRLELVAWVSDDNEYFALTTLGHIVLIGYRALQIETIVS